MQQCRNGIHTPVNSIQIVEMLNELTARLIQTPARCRRRGADEPYLKTKTR